MAQKSSHEIDMIHGPILQKVLLFNLPMAFSNMLQLIFNAADVIVVGRFAGANALAAVGSTTALVHMLVSFFTGISSGVNIVVARDYAAGKYDKVSSAVHTAVTLSFAFGVVACAIGMLLCRPVLRLMGSPDGVIDLSVIYLMFYYAGMPAIVVYNFGAAVLRSIGDTKRPMYYLVISGIVNVILNLFFVIVWRMSVAGVGLATALSNYLAAVLVLIALIREDSCLKLIPSKLRLQIHVAGEMLRMGVPAGLQGSLFGLSNVMIQSSVNSFGPVYMAGNAASQSIEGFQFAFLVANMNTALTFVSQNFGARQFARIRKIVRVVMLSGMAVAMVIGIIFCLLRIPLLSLYNNDPEVLSVGVRRLIICALTAAIEVPMDTLYSSIRGYGHTMEPTIVSLIGAVGFRILWINTVFRLFHTYEVVIWVWPVSWILMIIVYWFLYKKIRDGYPDTDAE